MEFRKYPHIDGLSIAQKFYGKPVAVTHKTDGSNFRVHISRKPLNKNSILVKNFWATFGSRNEEKISGNTDATWQRAIDYFIANDMDRIVGSLEEFDDYKAIRIVGEWLGDTKDPIRRDPVYPDRLTIWFEEICIPADENIEINYSVDIPNYRLVQFTKYYYAGNDAFLICTPQLLEDIYKKQGQFSSLFEGVVIKPIGEWQEDFIKQDLWDFVGNHPIFMKVKTEDYLSNHKIKGPKMPKPSIELTPEQQQLIDQVDFEDIIHSFQSSYPEYNLGDNRALPKLIPFLLETVNREILAIIEDKNTKRALSTLIVNHLKSIWC